MVLSTSALNYWLKAATTQALVDGEEALNRSKALQAADLQAEIHFTLYRVYNNLQQFIKAAEHLQRFTELADRHLSPEQRRDFGGEIKKLRQKASDRRRSK